MSYTENLPAAQAVPPHQAPLPALDFAKIDALTSFSMLSPSWCDGDRRNKKFMFSRCDRIVVRDGELTFPKPGGMPIRSQRHWFDKSTGVTGNDAIGLVAHVMKIDRDEAAERLARFLSLTIFVNRNLTEHGIYDGFLSSEAA